MDGSAPVENKMPIFVSSEPCFASVLLPESQHSHKKVVRKADL